MNYYPYHATGLYLTYEETTSIFKNRIPAMARFISRSIYENTQFYSLNNNETDVAYDSVFIESHRQPALFEQAYKNKEEIIDEFKNEYGKFLPADFDYESRIGHIDAVCYS